MLTLERLQEIQADLLADDIAIDFELMKLWTEDEVTTYFESGGVDEPAAAPVPATASELAAPPAAAPVAASKPAATPAAAPAAFAPSAGVAWPQNPDLTRFFDENHSTLAMVPPEVGDAGLREMMRNDKAANMAKLKDLGVGLKERQAIANALGKGKRAAEGFGVPVLVAMYSAGVSTTAGRGLMRELLVEAAKAGLADQLVLDHYDAPQYAGCPTWVEYISRLVNAIDAVEKYRGRPLVLVGHSHGTVGAYGLARALGSRVRLVVAVARRPPHRELLHDVWRVATSPELQAMEASRLLERAGVAWNNDLLVGAAKLPEKEWTETIKEVAVIMRAQYGSRLGCLSKEDIGLNLGGSDWREERLVVTPEMKLSCPILGVAAGKEVATGESEQKMEAWGELTSAAFTLTKIAGTNHMAVISHPDLFALVLKATHEFVERGRKEVTGL